MLARDLCIRKQSQGYEMTALAAAIFHRLASSLYRYARRPVAGFVKQELVDSILIAKQISVNIQLLHPLGHRLSCNGKNVYC